MAIQTMQEKIAQLRKRASEASLGGGKERLERQRQGGKLTARDRVEALVDADSFDECGLFAEQRATLLRMAGKGWPAAGLSLGSMSNRLMPNSFSAIPTASRITARSTP